METLSRGFALQRQFCSRAPGSKDNTALTAKSLALPLRVPAQHVPSMEQAPLYLSECLPNTPPQWQQPRSASQSACLTETHPGRQTGALLRFAPLA